VATAGCGGGSSGSTSSAAASTGTSQPPSAQTASTVASPPPTSLSRSQLTAQAEAMCATLNAQLLATNPKNGSVPEIARLAGRRGLLEQAIAAALSRLTPPAAFAHDWRLIVAYRRTLAQELIKLGQAAKANDAASIRSLAASKAHVHKQLSAIATRDGLPNCARTG
jgi:hypothetical protein